MILNVPRAGKNIEVKVKIPKFTRNKENTPISVARVIGVDTESLTVNGKLQTVLTPYSSAWDDFCQSEPIGLDQDPIENVLDYTMSKFGESIDGFRESRVISRLGKGTRETLTPCLWVFYNLEYDLQRLFLSKSPFFRYLRQGRNNVFVQVGKYKIQMVACNPSGSAPSFQIIAIDTITKMVCRIYGMDMWGYWKTGLDKTAKQLNVGEKVSDVPKEWFAIPLEEWDNSMWHTFTRYATHDPKLTRGIYIATAELLGSLSPAVFNKMGMLPPSAPAAAARMAFAMASEPEWERAPKACEQLALDAYHGGYVAMIKRGYVEGVTVGDLHSAYPSAFTLLKDPCTCRYVMLPPGLWLSIPNGYRVHGNQGFVRASFTLKQSLFPSISKNSPKHTLHQPGVYKDFAISLHELSAMFDLRQIDQCVITEGFILVGENETSFLRQFVMKFYNIKEESEKDSPVYLAAKLLMNALYGKLIEIHCPKEPALENHHDLQEWIVLPPRCRKFAEEYEYVAQLYIDKGITAIFEYSAKNINQHINDHKNYNWDATPKTQLIDILQSQTKYAGAYFIPIHASLTTAMTRAKLVIMLNCYDCIGGDTDSFFTYMKPNTIEWLQAEQQANEFSIRAGCGGVANQPGLLGYGIEMENGSGYIAGIKQYSLSSVGYKSKLAHHAITDPPDGLWQNETGKDEGEKRSKARKTFCHKAVQSLSTGQAVEYTTRKKPRRLRESLLKNDGNYGLFVESTRTVTPKEDSRLFRKDIDSNGLITYGWKELSECQ